MTKQELQKLIDKYEADYERNYQNYQETGMTRFSTAYHKAEDMADALRMALAAKADHDSYGYLKAEMHYLCRLAEATKAEGCTGKAAELADEVIGCGHIIGIDKWQPKE